MRLEGEIITCTLVEGKGKLVERVHFLSMSPAGSFKIEASVSVTEMAFSAAFVWCRTTKPAMSTDLCNLHLETVPLMLRKTFYLHILETSAFLGRINSCKTSGYKHKDRQGWCHQL